MAQQGLPCVLGKAAGVCHPADDPAVAGLDAHEWAGTERLYATEEKLLFRPPLCDECGQVTKVVWEHALPIGDRARWVPLAFTCADHGKQSA